MPDVREAYITNIMYVVEYSETCIHHFLRDCGKKNYKGRKTTVADKF